MMQPGYQLVAQTMMTRIQPINRQGKQGGGVALLHKERYQVTRDPHAPQPDLLEYGM